MNKIKRIKSKIEERIALAEKCANAACEKNLHNTLEANELLIRQYKSLLDIIDSISEEKPSEDLEEAANEYAILDEEGKWKDGGKYKGFIAGAEWQKEQDQPITGNSLEQEWLRYVDKKKKECRGELPALGEYGWLQIARHFAEWGIKSQEKKIADAYEKGKQEGIRIVRSWESSPGQGGY